MNGPDMVAAAEAGTAAWRQALHAVSSGPSEHGDFYALAGEAVATLRAIASLVDVLGLRVERYPTGRTLRDDAGGDPLDRVAAAVADLDAARGPLAEAEAALDRFWSGIGHIGLEVR